MFRLSRIFGAHIALLALAAGIVILPSTQAHAAGFQCAGLFKTDHITELRESLLQELSTDLRRTTATSHLIWQTPERYMMLTFDPAFTSQVKSASQTQAAFVGKHRTTTDLTAELLSRQIRLNHEFYIGSPNSLAMRISDYDGRLVYGTHIVYSVFGTILDSRNFSMNDTYAIPPRPPADGEKAEIRVDTHTFFGIIEKVEAKRLLGGKVILSLTLRLANGQTQVIDSFDMPSSGGIRSIHEIVVR